MNKNYFKTIVSFLLLSLFISCETSLNSLTHKVMFVNDDGTTVKKIDVEYGYKLKENDFPSIYIPATSNFDGWYNGNEKVSKGYTVDTNLILAPKFTQKAKVEKVIFNKDSGSFNYDKEHKIVLLCPTEGATIYYTLDNTTPTKESEVYSKPIDNITDSIIIKAYAEKEGMLPSEVTTLNYNINTCSIKYNSGRPSGDYIALPDNKILVKSKKLTIEELPNLGIISNNTLIFSHWVDQDGDIIKIGDELTKDLELTAIWKEYNGAAPVEISAQTQFIDYGESLSVSLSCTEPNSEIYYTLDGSEPTKSSTKYDNSPIFIEVDENKNKIELRARSYCDTKEPSTVTKEIYTLKLYTITFDNNGYGTKPESIQNLKKGDKVTLSSLEDLGADESVTPHKVFVGWRINTVPVTEDIIISSDVILVANWIDYGQISDVQFNKTGEVDYLDEVKLSCPMRGVSIYYTSDGSDPTDVNNVNRKLYISPIKIDESVKIIKAYATHEKLLQSYVSEASYRIKTYTVSFTNDKNGENPLPIRGLKKNDTVLTAGIPVFSLAGYDFKGWKDTSGIVFDSDYKIAQDTTLKAVLEPIVYNITYVFNSDSFNIVNDNPAKYTVEDEIILNTYIRSGWEAQWYDNESFFGDIVYGIPEGSTGNKTFYVKWNDIAPSEVTNLVATPGICKVTLSWDNPKDEDLSKVIITYDTNQKIEINITPNTTTKKEIDSLTNDTEYTFNIKTVDKQCNKSLGVNINKTPIPFYKYTETPKVVDSKIINGTAYDIVEFGDWPQTVYSGDPSELESCNNVNIWDNCYADYNGNFYVKATAHSSSSDYTYSDGTTIKGGQAYFFKLEPIRWRVLTDNYNSRKLLLAEHVLGKCPYFNSVGSERRINGKKISANNYKESEIRAFLNGYDYIDKNNTTNSTHKAKGFLQKAFTPSAIEKIANTLVDNSITSAGDSSNGYVCEDTEDKIFLLSKEEVIRSSYGFANYDSYDKARNLKTTDYSRAIGAYSRFKNNGKWWLRTPSTGSAYVNIVHDNGDASLSTVVDIASGGVVPALSISF